MIKRLLPTIFGMSIVAASVFMARPASAQIVWRSLYEEDFVIGVKGGTPGDGTPIVLWDYISGHEDQWWNVYSVTGSWEQLWTYAAPEPPANGAKCIALANNGSTHYDTPAISWDCAANTDDQYWDFYQYTTDNYGHQCYFIYNKKAYEEGKGYLVLTVFIDEQQNGTTINLEPWGGYGDIDQQLWCVYAPS